MKFTFAIVLFTAIVHPNLKSQQNGTIQGRIYNKANNEPIPYATLVVYGSSIGVQSDETGNFTFSGIKPGYVRIAASSVGFEQYVSEEFLVTNANKSFIEIPLTETPVNLDEIVVKASPYRRKEESPVSLRRIGIEQIEKNPGGNRDISKVIQSFPGVASTPAYRNDIIVRGGGPSENKFLLDGVEIPNLNHFSTQGASGGPVGIINVDFIREVNFYSGAFPANTGNAMSSVLDMRLTDGNKDHLKFRGSIGASDLALTLDGPLGEKTTFITSARRSYLQFLFSALELPFLPTYSDFQFKTRTKLDEKNEITFIGLGAIDQFVLNLDANETPEQRYILSYLPVNEQWNYTLGAVFKHFRTKGFDTWVLSRNYLNNTSYKYMNNDMSKDKTLDYKSSEAENKIRYERTTQVKGNYKINYGLSGEYAMYSNNTNQLIYNGSESYNYTYNTQIDMFNYGAFGQISKAYFDKRLALSFGLRIDGSSYADAMSNPLKQLSPRFSSSLLLTPEVSWNFNIGRYYQRPPYTAMGFKDTNDVYINRENGLTYIQSNHIVTGFEYQPNTNTLISIEGFYKQYNHYPFSTNDSVPLATKGADFGVLGNEEVIPVSTGLAYGFEILGQAQNLFGFNTVFSYTFVRSDFDDLRTGFSGNTIPSSWDNRHILNITATRDFKNNWYLGIKWRFVGGAPYTPFDFDKSSIAEAWDAQGGPYLNYSKFNTNRLTSFNQLDLRVDKQYYFKKWSINFYVDIQNVLNYKAEQPDNLVRKSFIDTAYDDYNELEGTYDLEYLPSSSGTVLPTIGIIVEF